jgi:hypothetical protein
MSVSNHQTSDRDTDLEVANAIQIAIMRKEILILETRSQDERDNLISHLKDCVEFSASGKFLLFKSIATTKYSLSASTFEESASTATIIQCLSPSPV